MSPPPFSIGTRILGGAALLLTGVLVVGFLLPTDWEAEASALFEAPPADVFGWLDAPEGWRAWTAWPDSGLVRTGPERGRGATIRWDDRELGSGSFEIVEAVPDQSIRYRVEVSGGAMRTEGTIRLVPEGTGVRVSWRETGDLGRNPLMGFWAFFMDRAQTTELERSLGRLGELVSDRARSR